MKKIGILSDTHSYLDPQLLDHFSDCDEIWHAGDIGSPDVTDQLQSLNTIKAVYGNIDDRIVQQQFPEDNWFTAEGLLVYITHIAGKPPKYNPRVLKEIRQKNPDVLVCGHSHILRVMPDKENNLLFINPGAAGQQGFHSMRTALKLFLENKKATHFEVIELGRRGRI
ncbi:MAG: metallophosphoesterase family protein [Candidatus Cyclobacteriaceae bacterium M2_1C_046]